MTDLEKRAHDIAVRILPRMIEEYEVPYMDFSRDGKRRFNGFDIADIYQELYESLLTELEEDGRL